MSIPAKIVGLFAALSLEDVRRLPPAERRRFSDMCAHWARLADDGWTTPQQTFRKAAKSGVLAILKQGERAP